ncbi:MAG: hydrogenase formation protein HypD [Candidatus Omnitrophica bacterium]|nr:hydrogenase formation protein HypD [Candidatus Omnitrophota bacterium]MBU1047330.1 hydrogenase formation protein HypD [Candidatus Omnitrophota bacterium]MBU1630657.1 hydrogenase formation protein HypD [Candidatus Omnitrophota bacterium]MBU1767768.1 hydrogenase formation protein HypD [Candidatus Omnitrophota bacterium]MBU1889085.1 hydrogenase formation protein HypD [Candidatus Omnitrophota bacterium]
MKYIDEFRNPELAKKLIAKISGMVSDYKKDIKLMEVCGTHTVAISRAGLRKLLPANLKLLSGPGCPVCVTPNDYLDRAIAYCRRKDVIVVTFGDMMKVPGSTSSLEKEKSRGGDVRIIYSPIDALKIAKDNPKKKIIFLGVGFETTSPTIAATIKVAKAKDINNFFVYSGHKVIPPAMQMLLADKEVDVDGFICPGHVSTIIGSIPYEFISKEHNIPCVVTGFETLDVVEGVYMLVKQIVEGEKPSVQIQYTRSVKKEGNPKAVALMDEVFEEEDSDWRGLGMIPNSGLKIRKEFLVFNALKNIEVKVEPTKENKQCICGEVLRGVKSPLGCKLFGKLCTPENPIGACMVSSEGTCAAYYKYGE